MPTPINLAALQELTASYFQSWDQAIADHDTGAAIFARKRIMDLARSVIKAQKELSDCKGGLYLFANCRGAEVKTGVVCYVGLVKAQTLAVRMANYLCEELSILDPKLLKLDEASANRRIEDRISMAMPRSKKIEKYVITHMKSRSISRADTIFSFPQRLPSRVIEDAETTLIVSAIACGQDLVNMKKLLSVPSFEGRGLAIAAISRWREEGLSEILCRDWLSKVQKMS